MTDGEDERSSETGRTKPGGLLVLALGATGVVYGDIGTSPLYTMRECLSALEHGAARDDVLGVCSTIVWAMTMVVTVKYLLFVLRADNHGEGGIFALLALAKGGDEASRRARLSLLSFLALVGAGLLYGDGVITPAISVMGALEGVTVRRPSMAPFVVPVACLILLLLFSVQHRGTGRIGRAFGPVMVLWFLTLATTGIVHIARDPEILVALWPGHAVELFLRRPDRASALLAAVVLAITGAEALYADMGHFGARPIRFAWFALAMPSLLLTYLGQGALLLHAPEAVANPFYHMVPEGLPTYLLVALATTAAIIASQALISGVFSLTQQAVQLGYFPRVTIRHTSKEAEGQIYVPEINLLLAIGCIVLVLAFGSTASLANAYGLAVCGSMLITSLVFFVVIRRRWKWPLFVAVPLVGLFLALDVPLLAANAVKFEHGGYVPVAIAVVCVGVMTIWFRGRRLLRLHYAKRTMETDAFLASLREVARVPGTAIFMVSSPDALPPLLVHHTRRNRSLHETVLLLSVVYTHRPFVAEEARATVFPLSAGFHRVVLRFGFMDAVDVPRELDALRARGLADFELRDATYYLGRETFLSTGTGRMGRVPEAFFAFLSRNCRSAVTYFRLPPEQVVELGTQIDL